MPNRIIHEKATASPTLNMLSGDEERFHWRLTTKADDYGRFDADPRVLMANCFPLKVGHWKPALVECWRNALSAAGLICLYTVRERLYGAYTAWDAYQRKRESKPKYPAPEEGVVYAPSMPPQIAATRRDSPQLAAYARAGVSRAVIESREARAESREAGRAGSGGEPPPSAATGPLSPLDPDANGHRPLFALWPEIEKALGRCRILGAATPLQDARWWLAELEANQTVDLVEELLKAEAWLVSHPRRRKSDYRRFLHTWLARAEREE
jgi:hypothetical protein